MWQETQIERMKNLQISNMYHYEDFTISTKNTTYNAPWSSFVMSFLLHTYALASKLDPRIDLMSEHPVVAVVTIHGMSHYITMGFHTLTLYRLHYFCKDEDLLTYSFLLMELVCTHNTYKTIKQGSLHEGLVCTCSK